MRLEHLLESRDICTCGFVVFNRWEEIRTLIKPQFTPLIEAYNTRSGPPEYKHLSEVTDDYQEPVTIDLTTLTINFDRSHE